MVRHNTAFLRFARSNTLSSPFLLQTTITKLKFWLICFLLAIVSVLGYSFLHKMLISFNHAVELIHMTVKFKWQAPLMKNYCGWSNKELNYNWKCFIAYHCLQHFSISLNRFICSHHLRASFTAKLTLTIPSHPSTRNSDQPSCQNQNQNCYWWHVQMTIIHQDLWWGKLVPSPYKRSELSNRVFCSFSSWKESICKRIPISYSLGEETALVNVSISKGGLKCPRVVISDMPNWGGQGHS